MLLYSGATAEGVRVLANGQLQFPNGLLAECYAECASVDCTTQLWDFDKEADGYD